MSQINLTGQVAIVTGAGAGLGRAYAHDLAEHGAAVVVNDVSREHADQVVAEIEQAGGRAVAAYDSVAGREGGRAIIAAAVESFGTVHVVVNNAGIMRNGWFEAQEPDDLSAVLDTHVGGCFWVTQAAWPVMREQAYGRVVMIGSAGGLWAMQALSNYAAAKGGVYGLARALAFEGRRHGILVNTVLPSAATTIASESSIPELGDYIPAEFGQRLEPRRTARAVAPMVTFLASQRCTQTGETYSAVAGRFARVIVGVTDGWFAEDQDAVTADDIAARLDEISDTEHVHVPTNLWEEYYLLARRLGASLGDQYAVPTT